MILICDACDKGFHGACHNPAVSEKSTDQTMPWICSGCQAEGYHVHTSSTICSAHPISSPSSADSGVSSLPVVTVSTSDLQQRQSQVSESSPPTKTEAIE